MRDARRFHRFAAGLVGVALGAALSGPAHAEGDPWSAMAPLLDKHCARCHQVGKTAGRYKERPGGNFGYVLDRDELLKRNKIIPGNADASEIFVKIVKGDMPKDIDDSCVGGPSGDKTYCGLSKDEQTELRDAINALKAPPPEAVVAEQAPKPDEGGPTPPSGPAASEAGPPVVAEASPLVFITDRDIIRMISDDVAKANTTDAPSYRYLSFTNLYNAGEPEKDLRVYRMALSKLLNSLSTDSDTYTPVAIDPQQTVYRIDLRRLGWSANTWDQVVAADPYVTLYNNSQFKALQRDLHTAAPFIRADWFTFQASRPPLYYTILDLPRTKAELQAKLGMNAQRDFEQRRVERAGFQLSGVSDNNRMVERHAIGTGAYWESYDFGANGDRKSLFEFPLGPPGAFSELSDKFGFNQDGGEIIFNLPNGFHAYYLTDGKGNRLDIGPTRIVRDPSQRDLAVTNGISCMGCHDKGIKLNDRRPGQPLDQVRSLILKSGSYPSEVKEVVGEIFPTADDFNRRLEGDLKHYAAALSAAGVNVNTKAEGVEMVNALSKRFEENLNARLAAAEVGMTEADFMERLDAHGGPAHDLKLRLQQDLVPRDQFVSLFATLVNTINDDGDKAIDLVKVAAQIGQTAEGVAKQGKKSPQTSKTFDLAFYANATSFKVGDLVTFTLRSEQPCFLTLLDSDDKGQSVILFPNAFHPDGKIEANTTTEIPGPIVSGFQIRAPEGGTERVTANCNASFPGLAQDFSTEKFTTFSTSRDLISAQTDARVEQQKAITRKLVIEKSEGPLARPGVAGTGAPSNIAPGDTSSVGQQLVANPIEPSVPITAQKSVVLNVRSK